MVFCCQRARASLSGKHDLVLSLWTQLIRNQVAVQNMVVLITRVLLNPSRTMAGRLRLHEFTSSVFQVNWRVSHVVELEDDT